MSEAWLAVIGATCGGVGLKAIEYLFNKNKVRDDTATQIRTELREEATALRAELQRVEDELDKWKQKYYDLLDQMYKQTKGDTHEGV